MCMNSTCTPELPFQLDINDVVLHKEDNIYYRDNPEQFDLLVEMYLKYHGKVATMLTRPFLSSLRAWVDKSLPLLSDSCYRYSTKAFWILSGFLFFPFCRECHSYEGYVGKNVFHLRDGYHKFCSSKCSAKNEETQQHYADACMKHYGAKHAFQAESVKKQIRASVKASTGYDCALKSPECREKGKKTSREKCGYDYAQQSPEYKERQKQRNLKNYGVEYTSQRPEVAKNISIGLKSRTNEQQKESSLKRQATTLREYGVRFYTQSEQYKAQKAATEDQRKEKEYKTKKANHSFKDSRQEVDAFWMLKFIFPKLIRQYKSKEYPFACDFYDPDQPLLRIEYQGSWTHGFHPFDSINEDDVKKLNKWASSGSKYYRNAAVVWSKRDPLKRQVAKSNGITLIEFWNLDQVREYVMSYFSKE